MSNSASNLPESVPVGGNRAWRPADGKIVRGRTEDSSYEEREAILGYLREIHVFYGETPDGQDYGKLEALLHTRNGLEVFGTNILNPSNGKPTLSSSVTFALALLDCAKDELIQINANRGSKKNRYNTYSTYVNVTGIDPITFAARGRRGESGKGDDRPEWTSDYLDTLLGELKEHPAYAERQARTSESTDTTFNEDEFDPFAEE